MTTTTTTSTSTSSTRTPAPTYQQLRGGVVDLAVVVEAVADLPLEAVTIDAATGAVAVTAPNPGIGGRVAHRLGLPDAVPSVTGQSITWTRPGSAIAVTASTLVAASLTGRTYGTAPTQRSTPGAERDVRGRRRGWAEGRLASVPTAGGRR